MLKKAVARILQSMGYMISRIPSGSTEPELSRLPKTTSAGHRTRFYKEFEFVSKLPGFLDINAYDLFCKLGQNYSKRNPAILEIGIFCGKSFLALSLAFREPSRAVGVDPFYEDFKSSPALEEEGKYLEQTSQFLTRRQRLNLLRKIITESEQLRPGLSQKMEVEEKTQDDYLTYRKSSDKFDIVHIDGEHTYEAVYNFFDETRKILNPNSIVIVDDFLNPGFPGISEAVHTHPTFKKQLFPAIYAFNKAVFVYQPAKGQVKNLVSLLAKDYRQEKKLVRPLSDGSIMVQ